MTAAVQNQSETRLPKALCTWTGARQHTRVPRSLGARESFLFLPKKGDDVPVVVANGDPDRPIIYWNGVDKAPRAEILGWRYRAQRIQLVDK